MQDIRLLRKSLETKKIGVLELVTDLLQEFETNHLGAVLCVNKEESFRQARRLKKKLMLVFQSLYLGFLALTKMFLLRRNGGQQLDRGC